MSLKSPFPDFVPLSKYVFYLDPPPPVKQPPSPPSLSASYVIVPPTAKKNEPPPPPSPELIVLCSWMDAAPKHILKYITSYRSLYPSAKIIIITSDPLNVSVRPRRQVLEVISPAADVVSSVVRAAGKGKQAKILLHTFSNGGAHSSRILALCYRKMHSTPLPIMGTIIDSAPGAETYTAFYRAFAAGFSAAKLPYSLYLLALLAVHIVVVSFVAFAWITALVHFTMVQTPPPGWLGQLKLDLNNSELYPKTVPRTYVFSDTDVMVDDTAVVENAEEAKKAGYVNVREEKFIGSPHVGHMIADPKRYWSIIETVVKDGTQK